MLNERIKQLRKQCGYSQMQLAKKLHLTQGAISQWENGLTVPAADQLVSLASVFGVSVDNLLEVEKPQDTYSDEAAIFRERIRRDPEYRMLFSAADKATSEHLKAAAAMLKALEPNDDN